MKSESHAMVTLNINRKFPKLIVCILFASCVVLTKVWPVLIKPCSQRFCGKSHYVECLSFFIGCWTNFLWPVRMRIRARMKFREAIWTITSDIAVLELWWHVNLLLQDVIIADLPRPWASIKLSATSKKKASSASCLLYIRRLCTHLARWVHLCMQETNFSCFNQFVVCKSSELWSLTWLFSRFWTRDF